MISLLIFWLSAICRWQSLYPQVFPAPGVCHTNSCFCWCGASLLLKHIHWICDAQIQKEEGIVFIIILFKVTLAFLLFFLCNIFNRTHFNIWNKGNGLVFWVLAAILSVMAVTNQRSCCLYLFVHLYFDEPSLRNYW